MSCPSLQLQCQPLLALPAQRKSGKDQSLVTHEVWMEADQCPAGLQEASSELFLQLLLAASHAFGPLIRQFISLGFNRVWLHAGETAYQ